MKFLAAPEISKEKTASGDDVAGRLAELHDFLKQTKLVQAVQAQSLPTGLVELDDTLPWKGLPPGGLSAFVGVQGTGRTRLWASTLSRLWVSHV